MFDLPGIVDLQEFSPLTKNVNIDRAYFKGRTPQGQLRFVKLWTPEMIGREYSVLANFNHPYVVRAHAAYVLDSQRAALVLDHYDGTSVENWRAQLSKGQIALIRMKLISAVQHLYDRYYFHGDLNESNVILTNELDPIIIDFEFAVPFKNRGNFESSADMTGQFGLDFASIIQGQYAHSFPGGRPYPYGVTYVIDKLSQAALRS